MLYESRPYREEEARPPKYLYRIDKKGIHIALRYERAGGNVVLGLRQFYSPWNSAENK